MTEHGCATCRLRAAHDRRPRSLIGRLWRWHITWCPGWRGYITSLSDEDRRRIEEKYSLPGHKDAPDT